MTKLYPLLLLCLFALTLPVTAREAEFKKIKESWTLQADGTQVYRQSKVLTLYTHTAMNRTYGESFITYDPRYQTLQIHESYTRQKDGNIIKTPANALVAYGGLFRVRTDQPPRGNGRAGGNLPFATFREGGVLHEIF